MLAITPFARRRWTVLLLIIASGWLATPGEWAWAQQQATSRPAPPLQMPRGRDPNAIGPDPSKLPGNANVPVQPRRGSIPDMLRRSAGVAVAPTSTRAEAMQPVDQSLRQRQIKEGERLLNDLPNAELSSGIFPRNSALGWWEVNKEGYLLKARENRPDAIEWMRTSPGVEQIVIRALRSRQTAVRSEAILAAGMMKLGVALKDLQTLTLDREPICALRAWTAIALIDSPQAMQFLKSPPSTKESDQIGWAMGVGLLSKPTDDMWEQIRKQVIDEAAGVEARRMAIWAIRNHKTPQRHGLLLDVIWHFTEPSLVCEAIQGLPEDPDPQDILLLNNLSQCIGESLQLPVVAQYGVNPRGIVDSIRAFPDLIDMNTGRIYTNMGDQAAAGAAAKAVFLMLRETAMRALATYDSPGDSARALLAGPVAMHIKLEGSFPAGRTPRAMIGDSMDLLHLGQIGDFDDYTILLDRFESSGLTSLPGGRSGPAIGPYRDIGEFARGRILTTDDLEQYRQLKLQQTQLRYDILDRMLPSRTFAALGIGLMWRKNVDMIVPAFGPDGDILTPPHETLMAGYQMPIDPVELHATCGLAMALAGTKERTRDIKRTMTLLQPGDEIVYGYGVFALGFFGDSEAIEIASTSLGPTRKTIDVGGLTAQHAAMKLPIMPLEQVLARRAAMQGLAVLGDPDAIPLLMAQWGKDPAVDREVARAILWCHRSSPSALNEDLAVKFGQGLSQLASNDNFPALAASALASLGVFYQQKDVDRLDKLIKSTNFRTAAPTADLRPAVPDARELPSPQRYAKSIANPYYYLNGTILWEQFLPQQPPPPARGR